MSNMGIVIFVAVVFAAVFVLMQGLTTPASGGARLRRSLRRRLEEIGAWLDVNGEAIYGTRPWSIAGEGPTSVLSGPFTDTERTEYTPSDIRFTTARGDLYATVLAPTRGSEVLIRSLAAGSGVYTEEIQSVTLLGYPGDVVWSRREDGLCIELPTGAATETLASFRIIAGPPIPPARRKILIQ